jgi:hypothetical protein
MLLSYSEKCNDSGYVLCVPLLEDSQKQGQIFLTVSLSRISLMAVEMEFRTLEKEI